MLCNKKSCDDAINTKGLWGARMGAGTSIFTVAGEGGFYRVTALGSYHKYWLDRTLKIKNEKCDNYSRLILDLKRRENRDFQMAVNFFDTLLSKYLSLSPLPPALEIIVVPSSTVGKCSPGLSEIAKRMCARYKGFYYRENSLERIRGISKLADGGIRDLGAHKNTLRYRSRDADAPLKILLDDVATSGNSVAACMDFLFSCNLGYTVFPIVLGKTV